MGKLVLVTGGARSGKSSLAVRLARELSDRVCYIATCEPHDDEMRERIRRHRAERPDSWRTVEEPLDPAGVIDGLDAAACDADASDVVLLDCLTLWVANLMGDSPPADFEEQAAERAADLAAACRRFAGHVIIVTNEVGSGIVPDNELARAFRDAAGRCNQTIGAEADEVYLTAAGIPVRIKPSLHEGDPHGPD